MLSSSWISCGVYIPSGKAYVTYGRMEFWKYFRVCAGEVKEFMTYSHLAFRPWSTFVFCSAQFRVTVISTPRYVYGWQCGSWNGISSPSSVTVLRCFLSICMLVLFRGLSIRPLLLSPYSILSIQCNLARDPKSSQADLNSTELHHSKQRIWKKIAHLRFQSSVPNGLSSSLAL